MMQSIITLSAYSKAIYGYFDILLFNTFENSKFFSFYMSFSMFLLPVSHLL